VLAYPSKLPEKQAVSFKYHVVTEEPVAESAAAFVEVGGTVVAEAANQL
jgi:hypothetical protein